MRQKVNEKNEQTLHIGDLDRSSLYMRPKNLDKATREAWSRNPLLRRLGFSATGQPCQWRMRKISFMQSVEDDAHERRNWESALKRLARGRILPDESLSNGELTPVRTDSQPRQESLGSGNAIILLENNTKIKVFRTRLCFHKRMQTRKTLGVWANHILPTVVSKVYLTSTPIECRACQSACTNFANTESVAQIADGP